MVGFFGFSALSKGGALSFESVEGFAVLSLHAELGILELSASFRSDFVDRTGLFYQKRTGVMRNVQVVFCFVLFKNHA